MDNDLYPDYQQALQPLIEQHFDDEELRVLCFALRLHYDNLDGRTHTLRTIALVQTMGRQARLAELYHTLHQHRPHVSWPPPPFDHTPLPQPTTSTPPHRNPFGQRGRLENPATYLPRPAFTNELWAEIEKGNSLSLVGASQTGKSSLLWQMTQQGPARLKRPPTDFIYLDMQMLPSDDDFFDCLCDHLNLPHLQGYRLHRALRGRRVLLGLDEIEQMKGLTAAARTQLRGLADGASTPLTLLIASRSPLADLFPDDPTETSPLAGLCLPYKMPLFTEAEAHALVAHYLRGTHGARWALPPDKVTAAWQTCAGHPGQLQQLLHALFKELSKNK